MQKPLKSLFAALMASVCLLLPWGASRTAHAATDDLGQKLFNDDATLRPQASPVPSTSIKKHAETSTIIWNGVYYMYYRTFVGPGGEPNCPDVQGIAVARSNDAGVTWSPLNGGQPIPALTSVQNGRRVCDFSDSGNHTTVYAPDVIVDGTRLVMVFEQRNHVINWNNTGSARALHSVRYVTSSDGINWSTSTQILAPGAKCSRYDEVGTPDIEKDGSGFVLLFHAHRPACNGQPAHLGRYLVRPPRLVENYSGTKSPIQLTNTPSWASFGVGMSDMTREPDRYWYIVFEAFSGATAHCGRNDTRTTLGIARSQDARIWTVRPAPLVRGLGTSCGWDMPSWQKVGPRPSIVTPGEPPGSAPIVRWNIVNRTNPVPVTSGSQLTQNQELRAGQSLWNGPNRLIMQTDGNLVLYGSNGVIWASDTHTVSPKVVKAVMQHDGNLVLIRSDGQPAKATGTDGYPGAKLQFDHTGIWIKPPLNACTTYANGNLNCGFALWRKDAGSRGL